LVTSLIPLVLSLIEGIVYLCSKEGYGKKFNTWDVPVEDEVPLEFQVRQARVHGETN
jgi:hypothetical protein